MAVISYTVQVNDENGSGVRATTHALAANAVTAVQAALTTLNLQPGATVTVAVNGPHATPDPGRRRPGEAANSIPPVPDRRGR